MPTVNFLYKREYQVNDKIRILIPSLRDIIDCEDDYYGLVTLITAMPIDLMVQLDDLGIDFTTINDWELFQLLFNSIKESPCLPLIFGDLDLSNYQHAIDRNEQIVLYNNETGDVIDRVTFTHIAWALREIHNLKKDRRKPGNGEAKQYMIQRARIKQKRAAKRRKKSELEDLIVAMVNTEQFKYDYESVLDLTIYQFNASLSQVVRKIHYDNLMYGAYTGNVDMTKVNQDELNWLTFSKT